MTAARCSFPAFQTRSSSGTPGSMPQTANRPSAPTIDSRVARSVPTRSRPVRTHSTRTAAPAAANPIPCRSISRSTSPRAAPSAMRRPISRRRAATTCASSP